MFSGMGEVVGVGHYFISVVFIMLSIVFRGGKRVDRVEVSYKDIVMMMLKIKLLKRKTPLPFG